MEHGAAEPAGILAVLASLQGSGFAFLVRDAIWIYPAANVVHVLAVIVFFASVALMDARLVGWLRAAPVADVIRRFRPLAIGAFVLVALSGFVLFTPEAAIIAQNPSFQLKMLALVLALTNVGLLQAVCGRLLADDGTVVVPAMARGLAVLSLVLWLFVAAAGRFIAYL